MITDRDITKLKTVFATKEDFGLLPEKLKTEGFATKDDLRGFATKDGLKGLAKTSDLKRFATKNDIKPLAVGIAGLDMRMYRLEGRIDKLDHRMDGLDEKMDSVMVTVSGIAENYETLRTGTAAGDHILARHTRQIEALAQKAKVKLPD